MSGESDSQVIFLIGAGGGIGKPLCERLAKRGATVIGVGRSDDNLKSVAEHCASTSTLDAKDPDAVSEAVSAIVKEHGRIDGAVNLAGSILLKPAHSTSPDEFRETIELNLMTAFHLVRAVAQPMSRNGGGSVVLMTSAVAEHGYPAHEAISAAKAGVIGLARSAASTYASKGVRFNCVAPGLTDTPLAGQIFGSEPALKASLAMHANGKAGQPEQVASAIDFLLQADQAHVTGQVLAVDGGLSRVHAK